MHVNGDCSSFGPFKMIRNFHDDFFIVKINQIKMLPNWKFQFKLQFEKAKGVSDN